MISACAASGAAGPPPAAGSSKARPSPAQTLCAVGGATLVAAHAERQAQPGRRHKSASHPRGIISTPGGTTGGTDPWEARVAICVLVAVPYVIRWSWYSISNEGLSGASLCLGCSMPACELVSSFASRQGVLLIAGCMFLGYTYVQIQRGVDKRNFATFAADCTKQAGQQMFGGVLMAVVGVLLAQHSGLDALSWYASEYPFEIVTTTILTHVFKKWSVRGAERLLAGSGGDGFFSKTWLEAMALTGRYGEDEHEFDWAWYRAQMFQAIVLVGIPARLLSVLFIFTLLSFPQNPVLWIASAWFHSPYSCATRTAVILYVIPVMGDAVQFVIIDSIQRFHGRARLLQ